MELSTKTATFKNTKTIINKWQCDFRRVECNRYFQILAIFHHFIYRDQYYIDKHWCYMLEKRYKILAMWQLRTIYITCLYSELYFTIFWHKQTPVLTVPFCYRILRTVLHVGVHLSIELSWCKKKLCQTFCSECTINIKNIQVLNKGYRKIFTFKLRNCILV